MPRDLKNPPSWAPKAVATTKGWVDPKTGELLVSVKGLTVKKKAVAKKTSEKKVTKKKAVAKKETE